MIDRTDDGPDNLILRYLREIDRKLDALNGRLDAWLLAAPPIPNASIVRDKPLGEFLPLSAYGLSARIDGIEHRLERIERRLNLVEASP